MQDANGFDDLRQLSLGQVKALKYGRYDINRHHFRMAKLEVSRPLAATINSGVVANGEYVSGLACHILKFSFRNVNHFSHKKLKISKKNSFILN
jgi:hypothetical protein